ncbi:hypothetical protein [Streptomyces sp. NBC_01589]
MNAATASDRAAPNAIKRMNIRAEVAYRTREVPHATDMDID